MCPFPRLGRVGSFARGPWMEEIRLGEEGRGAPGQHGDSGLTNNSNNKKLRQHIFRAYCVPGPLHTSPLMLSMTLHGDYVSPILQKGDLRLKGD